VGAGAEPGASDVADGLAFRDHLKSNGVKVTPLIDHEFCKSIYFKDPDGMQLEVSYWVRALDRRDIGEAVLERLTDHVAAFVRQRLGQG